MWSRLRFLSKPVQNHLRYMWQPISSSNSSVNFYRKFSTSLVSVESAVIDQLKNTEGVEVDKISNKCFFDEIGLDSLAEIELFTALEEKFGITLAGEDTDEVRSVPDLVKLILSKVK